MPCDVHPNKDSKLYLEESYTGQCYYFCSISELEALLSFQRSVSDDLVPCGHQGADTPATWPSVIGLVPLM